MDKLLAAELAVRRQRDHVQDTVRLSGILCQPAAMRRRGLRYVDESVLAALQCVRPAARKHIRRHWSHSVRHQ